MPGAALDILAERVQALIPAAGSLHDTADTIPIERGSYLLMIALDRPRLVPLRGRSVELEPGHYVYAGSARGSGGLRARLGRHLTGGKRPHWHIDHLTAGAIRRLGLAYPGAIECDLRHSLSDSGAFEVPVPGFGSSDCRICPAHLLLYSGKSL